MDNEQEYNEILAKFKSKFIVSQEVEKLDLNCDFNIDNSYHKLSLSEKILENVNVESLKEEQSNLKILPIRHVDTLKINKDNKKIYNLLLIIV